MQTVVDKPPTYVALHWDGSNTKEFTDNLSGVNAMVSGDDLVLVKDSVAKTVPKDGYFILASLDVSINAGNAITADVFAQNYQSVSN